MPLRISQDKLRQKRRRIAAARITGVAFLAVGAWCGLSLLSFADPLEVDRLVVAGAKQGDARLIAAAAESEISRNILAFFSGKNAFLLQRGGLKDSLKERFSVIDEVEVDIDGLDTLSIEITEREPKAAWCGPRCYSLDESGLAFIELDPSETESLLVFSGGNGGEGEAPGFRFMDESGFRSLLYFATELGRMGTFPKAAEIVSSAEVRFAFKEGGEMIIDPANDLSEAISRIWVLRNDPAVRFGSSGFMQDLDYIDMRYGNRIVYKKRGEAEEVAGE